MGAWDPVLTLLMPLGAAVLYVVAALLIKRSTDFGVGPWRTLFVSNLIGSVVFLALIPFGGSFPVHLLWQPAIGAGLFMFAQFFNYLGLQRGDVSVATPVLGLKVVLVALFATLLRTQAVTPALWVAAGLSSLGIVLLNRTSGPRHHLGSTILYSFLTATLYALFDVLMQKWQPHWGTGRYLPAVLGFVAVFSFALIPFFKAPLTQIARPAWPWLLGGCVLISVQSLLFSLTIALYHNATAANVLYSSRGLWSVVAVWAVGHWFSNREQHLGATVLRWRFAGALLMLTAVVLVVVG
jgi:drug/metabolite transporter (DMT)-like permease